MSNKGLPSTPTGLIRFIPDGSPVSPIDHPSSARSEPYVSTPGLRRQISARGEHRASDQTLNSLDERHQAAKTSAVTTSSRLDLTPVKTAGPTASRRIWKRPKTTRSKARGWWWTWEILCELLAISSLIATVLVLAHYNQRPQEEWQQAYFTLNGLVAFLATCIKTGLIIPVSAAIGQRKWLRFLPDSSGRTRARRLGEFEVFDEASRGSLGSTKMIFAVNAWSVNLSHAICLPAYNLRQGRRMPRRIHHHHFCAFQYHHTKCAKHLHQHSRRETRGPSCWRCAQKRILECDFAAHAY